MRLPPAHRVLYVRFLYDTNHREASDKLGVCTRTQLQVEIE